MSNLMPPFSIYDLIVCNLYDSVFVSNISNRYQDWAVSQKSRFSFQWYVVACTTLTHDMTHHSPFHTQTVRATEYLAIHRTFLTYRKSIATFVLRSDPLQPPRHARILTARFMRCVLHPILSVSMGSGRRSVACLS